MNEKIKENIMKEKCFNELVEYVRKLSETEESLEITDKEIKSISKETTLKIMRISSDKINFDIMCMLPSYPEVIQERVELSDYQYFKHMKQLKKYELIQEDDKTHEVQLTNFGKNCVELIDYIIDSAYISIKSALKSASEIVQEK